ncbi:MAG: D-glycerate dehydrogenase, partial [Glaciimonas sp.]|nr:D-glycerate dehydrogenase [Glaciimonas sp.]
MSKPKILVARAIFPEVIQYLEGYFEVESNQEDEIFSHAQLLEKLRDKDGVIPT